MHILVIGASGYAGRHISRELVKRGHRVDGVSRQPGTALEDGVQPYAGEMTDLEFLAPLVERADAVLLAVRAGGVEATGLSYAQAIEGVLPLLRNAGTRLGVVGGAGSLLQPGGARRHMDIGADDSHPVSNPGESVRQAEVLDMLRGLADDDVDWFYVSPPALFGSYAPGERTGSYRVGADELLVDETGASHISGEDFAIAFADEVETPRHHRQRFTVGY